MFLYDKINVLDLEATCWERGGDYQREYSEIIEIGICKYVVASAEITDKRSFYVVPERSEISPYCTALTGITPELVREEGTTLARALDLIRRKYSCDKRLWAGWGEYDRAQLLAECARAGIACPFQRSYLNVKALYAMRRNGAEPVDLDGALGLMGVGFEGRPHSGADDAYNAARVLREVLT